MNSANHDRPPSTCRRLAWFAVLWCAGVATLGVIAWVLRAILHAAS